MASFNGSNYIEDQIKSILVQLGTSDEIIIVDDASTDDTIEIINNLYDSRIKIFHNDNNIGVIPSFERALSLAKGDVIFLSDQDDVWLPNKVEKIMKVFFDNPDVTLCISDAEIINELGNIKKDSYFKRRGIFRSSAISNILKNKFLGCSIAYKASMNENILPFPSRIPAHDMWIGIINSIYGKSSFIDEPLFYYRRHSENVTSMKHQNLLTMLRWRIDLIYNLLVRLVRNYFS